MHRPNEDAQDPRSIHQLDPRGLPFLARTFAAGAAYDLAMGILILHAPPSLLAALAIPAPPDLMHFRFARTSCC